MSDTLLDTKPGLASGEPQVAARSMRAIGTSATVAVAVADRVDDALALLADDLQAIDDACSRFRSDSELRQVEQSSQGMPLAVTPLLFRRPRSCLRGCGEDRRHRRPDHRVGAHRTGLRPRLDEVATADLPPEYHPQPAPGWWQIALDPEDRTVAVPSGVHIDLGATAKAFIADRSAQRIAAVLDCAYW